MTPKQAYYICRQENKRKPELEPIILTDSFFSYLYALNIIKGRWTEGEPIILNNPQYAYSYAFGVIKGRWPEAERILKQNDYWWKHYCLHFRKEKVNWKKGL